MEWRRRAKARLVAAFGGACGICGYDRCHRNLHFHHVDPAEKDFALGQSQTAGWDRIVAEMRKCVMLCSICHGEVHDGVLELPDDIPRFDERHARYREGRPPSRFAGMGRGRPGQPRPELRKVERPDPDTLQRMLHVERRSLLSIGRDHGVSDVAVRKWAVAAGIELPRRRAA